MNKSRESWEEERGEAEMLCKTDRQIDRQTTRERGSDSRWMRGRLHREIWNIEQTPTFIHVHWK